MTTCAFDQCSQMKHSGNGHWLNILSGRRQRNDSYIISSGRRRTFYISQWCDCIKKVPGKASMKDWSYLKSASCDHPHSQKEVKEDRNLNLKKHSVLQHCYYWNSCCYLRNSLQNDAIKYKSKPEYIYTMEYKSNIYTQYCW